MKAKVIELVSNGNVLVNVADCDKFIDECEKRGIRPNGGAVIFGSDGRTPVQQCYYI